MNLLTAVVVALIGVIVFCGLIGYVQTGYYLKKWLRELRELEASDSRTPDSRWIREVCQAYRHYHLSGIAQLNTQGLIEKHLFQERIPLLGIFRVPVGNISKFLQQLPSFSIILGVLGTFIGLTLSLLSMQDTLFGLGHQPASSNITINTIIASLTAPFKGMSTAFITSIAGVSGALVLTSIQSGFLSRGASIAYLQGKVMADCEVYLDHQFNSALAKEKPQDGIEPLLDRLVTKVEESFQKSIGDFGSSMIQFTAGLKKAMEDVQGIFEIQRKHTERFATSAKTLDDFGVRFHETTTKLGTIQKTVDGSISALAANISSFEKQVKAAIDRQSQSQQKFEQLIMRSDKLLESGQRKYEELNHVLLRGMQEQLEHYQTQHEALENRLAQKQDEWYYRYSEKQGEYGRAAADFASSVGQLEKGFYSAIELIKRDFVEQIRNVLERERQYASNQTTHGDEMREVARAMENLYHGLSRDLNSSNRTLTDMYHLLQRIYQTAMQSQVIYEPRDRHPDHELLSAQPVQRR
ncbi:hypothetical protein [Fictibacillus gelatini]|uniref:hypothetical protein n=1 Tax=Fictibacillus gelatini TaxID=225985 RepID=UPI00041BCC90|nr:hypothetical protein [Fictibacillus gelatini]